MSVLNMSIWVVIKIMVPLWIPQILGARIVLRTQKGAIMLTTTHIILNTDGSFLGGAPPEVA